MSGRIIAAGIALALVAFAWQAGASFKSVVNAKATHHAATASTPLPAAFTLHTAWGNVTCTLSHATYSCTAPATAQPVPPALYTTGAR